MLVYLLKTPLLDLEIDAQGFELGTWMSIVEGFGGMRVKNNTLSFIPQIPLEWKAYSFKVNFRGQIVKVNVTNLQTTFELEGGEALDIIINDCPLTISPKILVAI